MERCKKINFGYYKFGIVVKWGVIHCNTPTTANDFLLGEGMASTLCLDH